MLLDKETIQTVLDALKLIKDGDIKQDDVKGFKTRAVTALETLKKEATTPGSVTADDVKKAEGEIVAVANEAKERIEHPHGRGGPPVRQPINKISNALAPLAAVLDTRTPENKAFTDAAKQIETRIKPMEHMNLGVKIAIKNVVGALNNLAEHPTDAAAKKAVDTATKALRTARSSIKGGKKDMALPADPIIRQIEKMNDDIQHDRPINLKLSSLEVPAGMTVATLESVGNVIDALQDPLGAESRESAKALAALQKGLGA